MTLLTPLRNRLGWRLHRASIRQLDQDCMAMVAAGEVDEALVVLERLQSRYRWPFCAESLLFRRSQRPQDSRHSLQLFQAMHRSGQLLPHQRRYACLAGVYTALAIDDRQTLRQWSDELVALAQFELSAAALLEGEQRNRESPYKLVISARSCLLQVGLLEADGDQALRIASANRDLLEGLRWRRLNADTAYRSVSNLVRGLLPLGLIVDQRQGLCVLLQDLRREFEARRYRPSRQQAQEDHLRFLDSAIDLLHGDRPPSSDPWLALIVNTPAAAVRSGAERWLAHAGGA